VIGGVLSAKTLNDNFAAVESRLLAVEGMQHDSATVEQCGGADCTNAVSITSSVAWISLISRSSIGNYTVYFPTGHYSKPPTCVVTGNYRGGTGAFCMPAGAAVKTSQSVMCVALQGSGGGNAILLDAPFNIACHGPA
jgi:hypothetical protein